MRFFVVTDSAVPSPTRVPVAHRPDAGLPRGEVLGHGQVELGLAVLAGRQRRRPTRPCRRTWCARSAGPRAGRRRRRRRLCRLFGLLHRHALGHGTSSRPVPTASGPPHPRPCIDLAASPPGAARRWPNSAVPRAPGRAHCLRRVPRPPRTPEDAQVAHADFASACGRSPEPLDRLSCPFVRCCRRHFQKNSLMSGTFEPPEMYSTALSYIVSTSEPTYGSPVSSVTLTVTLAFCAGLVLLGRGRHLHVQHALGRAERPPRGPCCTTFAAVDRQRLDEEVRHVLLGDLDRLERALAFQPNDLRRQVHAVARPHEQHHRRAGAVGVDHQLDLLAGRVFLLVRDELDVVEPVLRAVEALAANHEDVPALDAVTLGVGHLVAQPILAGLGGLHLLVGLALRRRYRASTSARSDSTGLSSL